MGEYGREQRKQESRVIANYETGSKQLKGIVDNRSSVLLQSKLMQVTQRIVSQFSLTPQYHREETKGDSISIYSVNIAEHEQAIAHYRNAIQLRKREAAVHGRMDAGHQISIDTLWGKIAARLAIIKRLTPPTSAVKAKPGPPPPPPSSSSATIGTADQASWITGISAWQPRKY